MGERQIKGLSESYVTPAQAGQPNCFEPLHVRLERAGRLLALVDRYAYSERHRLHAGRERFVVFEYEVAGAQLTDCDLCGEPEALLKTAAPVDVLTSTDDRTLAVEHFRRAANAMLAGDNNRPVAQRKEQAGISDSATKPPANDPGSNPGGPTIPDWPITDFWIVSYSYGTDFVATRHRGGCGVLRNARMTQDENTSGGRYGRLSVIEEERYRANMARNPGLPEPDNHSCCAHAAPVASFRHAEATS